MSETRMLVIDASVIVKWVLHDPVREDDTRSATELMRAIVDDRVAIRQPIQTDNPLIIQRACKLAIDFNAHVFDTLYHAVAMESENGYLVTADDRYLDTSRHLGHVVGLHEWQEILT